MTRLPLSIYPTGRGGRDWLFDLNLSYLLSYSLLKLLLNLLSYLLIDLTGPYSTRSTESLPDLPNLKKRKSHKRPIQSLSSLFIEGSSQVTLFLQLRLTRRRGKRQTSNSNRLRQSLSRSRLGKGEERQESRRIHLIGPTAYPYSSTQAGNYWTDDPLP